MVPEQKSRRFFLVGVLAFCLTVVGAFPVAAEDLSKIYNGKLIISPEPFPSKFDEEMEKFLKTVSQKDGLYQVKKSLRGSWSFHMMAFFGKDPGNDTINLVFYDSEDKESQKKLQPIQSLEFKSTKGVRVFSLPDLSLSSGFEEGKTYLVKITQLKKGKEVVLSEAKLKLNGEE